MFQSSKTILSDFTGYILSVKMKNPRNARISRDFLMVGETGLAACGHLTPSQGETSVISMLSAIVSTTVSTAKFFQMNKHTFSRLSAESVEFSSECSVVLDF